eukprot:scaffold51865_cov74-Phaeocystis_antarctica.AAC.1
MGSAGHTCLAREGPGSTPAAQTPSALGRPARRAASARGGKYRLGSTGSTLLGYRRGSRWAIDSVRAAGEVRKGLRATVYEGTGMAWSTFLLTLGGRQPRRTRQPWRRQPWRR